MFSVLSFSQEKENYKDASKQVMTYFNTANYDAIFSMFDESMKASLPKEQAIPFFVNINKRYGKMKSMMFSNTKQAAHIYKTTFDDGVRDILIYLNTKNEIGGLFVTPHKPDDLPKLEKRTAEIGGFKML